jgi:hypothetical protein
MYKYNPDTIQRHILSHEKMSFYAYISIADVVLKLGIVGLLVVSSLDKTYSVRRITYHCGSYHPAYHPLLLSGTLPCLPL